MCFYDFFSWLYAVVNESGIIFQSVKSFLINFFECYNNFLPFLS